MVCKGAITLSRRYLQRLGFGPYAGRADARWCRTIPPVTATLRESNPSAMGMRTVRQRARSAAGSPGPSAPRMTALLRPGAMSARRSAPAGLERDGAGSRDAAEEQWPPRRRAGGRRGSGARRLPRRGSTFCRADRSRWDPAAPRPRRRRRRCETGRRHLSWFADAVEDQHGRLWGQGGQQGFRVKLLRFPAHGQNAPVQGEPGDGVDHALARHIEGGVGPERRRHGPKLFSPLFGQQDGLCLEPRTGQQMAQHHLPLGDEQALRGPQGPAPGWSR